MLSRKQLTSCHLNNFQTPLYTFFNFLFDFFIIFYMDY